MLKREHRKCNLFHPEWWVHLEGKEHRWARALNSSQCFAVNLFAPLHNDEVRARRFVQEHLKRDVGPDDNVSLEFEFTPDGTKDWLGEKGQPTQIDVYFKVERSGCCIGHVLVEVKFTEASFGCCRGWNAKLNGLPLNPNSKRCLDVSAVVTNPKTNCWLAQPQPEGEGRRYWEIISGPDSSIRKGAILAAGGACPFRYGLYQMMRNRVLADELRRQTKARWADFVVCHHPKNQSVLQLNKPVSATTEAIPAFQALSSNDAVRLWNAEEVIGRIGSMDRRWSEWETWM